MCVSAGLGTSHPQAPRAAVPHAHHAAPGPVAGPEPHRSLSDTSLGSNLFAWSPDHYLALLSPSIPEI